jgi:hypothetical protein
MDINISSQVTQTITDGVTTTAPSENAVFDALALKLNTATAATTYQPLDADLTSIAALGYSVTSFLKKTALNTWALDTSTYISGAGANNKSVRYTGVGTVTSGSWNDNGANLTASISGAFSVLSAASADMGGLTADIYSTGGAITIDAIGGDATLQSDNVVRINGAAGISLTGVVGLDNKIIFTAGTDEVPFAELTTGVTLTTPVQGSIEWDGNRMYLTDAGGRETVAYLSDVGGGGGITIGTSTITSGTNTRILYNNSGIVGEYTLTGSGTSVAMGTSPIFVTDITTPKIIGGTANTSKITNVGSTNASVTAGIAHEWGIGNNGTTIGMSLFHSNQLLLGTTTAPGGALAIPFRIGSGTNTIDIGSYNATFSSIWFNQSTPSTSNFGFLGNSSTTYLNGTSNVYFTIGGAAKVAISSTGMRVGDSTNPSTTLHVNSTTEQVRVGYDSSNYLSIQVTATGATTYNAVGSGAKHTFSDNVELTQTVTTEALTSDRSVTIVINGTTYKLLAKA